MKYLIAPAFISGFAGLFALHLSAAQATSGTIYSFCSEQNCADGANPAAGLISTAGLLYGTTFGGGGSCPDGTGCGTLFSLHPKTGAEAVLHSFQNNGADGYFPEAGLINVKGTLYSTTLDGGAGSCACGTLFSLDPATGAETVLHSFGSGTDGQNPESAPTEIDGVLYGMTSGGGTYGSGVVYSLDPATGDEKVLHSFGNGTDGADPHGALVGINGILYGTTYAGGTRRCNCGTVFSLDLATGAEAVLYSFGANDRDGEYPEAGLIDVNGKLYGTTETGRVFSPFGTAFSFDPETFAETVLYSFGSADGTYPEAALIYRKRALYGTTFGGGAYGYGTVFSLDRKTGAETVLHSFGSDADGANPWTGAGLIYADGTLYGTTFNGGGHSAGTVFSIVP